jgi:hypothetical protein
VIDSQNVSRDGHVLYYASLARNEKISCRTIKRFSTPCGGASIPSHRNNDVESPAPPKNVLFGQLMSGYCMRIVRSNSTCLRTKNLVNQLVRIPFVFGEPEQQDRKPDTNTLTMVLDKYRYKALLSIGRTQQAKTSEPEPLLRRMIHLCRCFRKLVRAEMLFVRHGENICVVSCVLSG